MCACNDCPMHDICRGAPEPGGDMCTWCDIERSVEMRWQQMLTDEA